MPGPDIYFFWCRQCVIAREITKLHEEVTSFHTLFVHKRFIITH